MKIDNINPLRSKIFEFCVFIGFDESCIYSHVFSSSFFFFFIFRYSLTDETN